MLLALQVLMVQLDRLVQSVLQVPQVLQAQLEQLERQEQLVRQDLRERLAHKGQQAHRV